MTDPLIPIGRTGAAASVRPRPRLSGNESAAFDIALSDTADSTASETGTLSAIGAVNPMLLHELAVDEKGRRDRDAHRHGTDVLDLLAELQRALLGARVEGVSLERLAQLVSDAPEAADPALAAVSRAIVLRARLEIARRLPRPPAED